MGNVIDLTEERPSRRIYAFFVAGWTAIVILQAVLMKVQLPHIDMAYAFLTNAVEMYTLALLSLGVWRVTRWLHERRWPVVRWVASHALLAVAGVTVWQGIHMSFLYRVRGPGFWDLIYADSWAFQLVTVVTTYGAVLGATLAIQSAQRERHRERQHARLELTTREAELAALKAQLQPHFLFNSLNSIVSLIDTDPAGAREMVVRLASLLQSALRRIDLEQVSLDGELDLVRAYLDIEQIRFASRLHVDIDVDAEARTAGVPPLLLQPLVENAVKHGIAAMPEGGLLRVSGRVDAGRLMLEISDSGRGGGDTRAPGSGLGLELTRRRLDAAYGTDYELWFERLADRFAVRLDLPFAHA